MTRSSGRRALAFADDARLVRHDRRVPDPASYIDGGEPLT
jgi:hypothetical protein